MRIVSLECPNCHASLRTTHPDQMRIRCEYCGHEVALKQTTQIPTPQPPRRVEIQYHHVRTSRGSRAFLVVPLVLVLGVAGVGFLASKGMLNRTHGGSGPGGGGHVPPGEHLQWESQHAPLALDVDGDGTEDIVGIYHLLEGGATNTYLGAFSGKTWKRLWKTSSFGDSGVDYQLRVGASGDAVVVVDQRGVAHIFDRGSGLERDAVQLSDKAERVCHADESHVWIQVADEANVLLDVRSMDVRRAEAPEGCRIEVQWHECSSWDLSRMGHPHARCVPQGEHGKASGMRIDYALRAGEHEVALGTKAKGTTISMVAGFDVAASSGATREARWVRTINPDERSTETLGAPETVDLVDGKLVLVYRSSAKELRVAAIDVANGQTLWDTQLPRSDSGSGPDVLTIGATRVYVPHWTWLDIFDLRSGEVMATIGKW